MTKTKREKKGMCLYYSFLDIEFEEMNYEEIGLITTALLQLDYKKQVDEDLLNTINENQKLKILFREMSEKVKFATEKWERLQKRKNDEEETNEQTSTKIIIKTADGELIERIKNDNYILKKFSVLIENKKTDLIFYGNSENIPQNINEVEELVKNKSIFEISEGWYWGNNDEWKEYYKNYFFAQ